MNKIISQIESLLLVTAKPLSYKELAKLLDVEIEQIEAAGEKLQEKYNTSDSGIQVLLNNKQIQLVTNPDNVTTVKNFLQAETTGELSRPSMETLTIIAYRQPITKEALEQIRGINCSLILRNLLIRGLIEAKEIKGGLTTTYSLTMDFLRFLGVHKVEELPDYETLHSDQQVQAAIAEAEEKDLATESQ
jgi:segregation and condensation protein B